MLAFLEGTLTAPPLQDAVHTRWTIGPSAFNNTIAWG